MLGEKFDHLSTGRFGSSVSDPTLTFAGRLSLYTTNWPYYDQDVQKELGAATLHDPERVAQIVLLEQHLSGEQSALLAGGNKLVDGVPGESGEQLRLAQRRGVDPRGLRHVSVSPAWPRHSTARVRRCG